MPRSRRAACAIGCLALLPGRSPAVAATPFGGTFAPAAGLVRPEERPWRDEVCLDGRWQFQSVDVPPGYVRDRGEPPPLPEPTDAGWDPVPLKVPSPWNVNTWGNGRGVGPGTPHPYWPDSVYFPSYPARWDAAEMGWMRRTFGVPAGWRGGRLVLHFEAVGGDCQVRVNGRAAGGHFDTYLPLDLDVTELVRPGATNELLVGVRAHSLFDAQDARYPKMRKPYPCGSNTDRVTGIWQDVFLLHRPAVRVGDTFVQPLVDRRTLQLDVTLDNDTDDPQPVHLGGSIDAWAGSAGGDTPAAAVPRWQLGPPVAQLAVADVVLPPHATRTITVRQPVADGTLKLWAPGSPNLYVARLVLDAGGRTVDATSTRFGWRQFTVAGPDLLLNGRKIQLVGDLLHPFGPFVLSRSYAWAWYRMVQDMGGNCVRLHAQPHPLHFLDLADEMGVVVLDETAIFGSAASLNFAKPVAWDRFAAHYDGLVLRDRDHPSVMGWSFGNELFAIFNLNRVDKPDADRWYAQLAELGLRARRLDPTRPWISCDGDEDLRGTLPVYSKHFGLGLPPERLPDVGKPLMVGESGGTYYARPGQLAAFNGDDAYASYAARNDALGIDVYDNLVHLARPQLAYFSASETAWFGLEHLNFGYHDFDRPPTPDDGVRFTAPFEDGRPGFQPERLPPYVATLNPGWDPSLPLYRPLGMFQAERAALAPVGPQPCRWDRRHPTAQPAAAAAPPTIDHVGFVGDPNGPLARRCAALGVPITAGASHPLTIVDADTVADVDAARRAAADTAAAGGAALVMTRGADGARLARLLPDDVRLSDRDATALVSDPRDRWTRSFTREHLYFAEAPNPYVARHGMAGPFVDRGRVLLADSDADWSLFNDAPEAAKCGAEVLYEHLRHPSGAVLVAADAGPGRIAACTIDYDAASTAADAMWRGLFAGMGVTLGPPQPTPVRAFDGGVLVAALALGRFADPVDLGTAAQRPMRGQAVRGRVWLPVTTGDRFTLARAGDGGPTAGPGTVYFSCWVKSPRATDDLLGGGPDAARVDALCYAGGTCRLSLNGRPLAPTRTEPADYRQLLSFDGLPLVRGWNHILVQVDGAQLQDRDRPPSIAMRLTATNAQDLRQLDSAVERPAD